jgi:cell division protein ZapE
VSLPSRLYQKKGLTSDAVQNAILPKLDQFCETFNSSKFQLIEDKGLSVWRCTDGSRPSLQGLYMFGTVGRGKSMLMQDVFDSIQTPKKRRVHFHSFMEELHTRMHDLTPPKGIDRMHFMASEIARDCQILCFDEFFITNIADGMMLGRLVDSLFHCGVTLCATSNWNIENLFQDGHNRSHLMPFMKSLKASMDIVDLGSGRDYRKQDGAALFKAQHSETFKQLTGVIAEAAPFELGYFTLKSKGIHSKALWTSFEQLCEHALGRAEYLELVSKHNHLLIDEIPELDVHKTEAIMRFIVMVDIAYEAGVPVLLESQHDIDTICTAPDAAFAFERTLSRIYELNQIYTQQQKSA